MLSADCNTIVVITQTFFSQQVAEIVASVQKTLYGKVVIDLIHSEENVLCTVLPEVCYVHEVCQSVITYSMALYSQCTHHNVLCC